MKATRILILLVLLSFYFGANAQNGDCYEIKSSMSGHGTILYPQIMFDTICKLVKIVDENDNNNKDFKVLSYDVYPILAYANLSDGIDYQISEIKKEFADFPEYSAVIKAFINENIRYNFFLKLPSTGIFSTITTMQSEAIQVSVENAMIDANAIIPGNFNTEIHGFRILNAYLKQIKDGTLNIDVFDNLGFQPLKLNQNEAYITSNNIQINEEIRDYCGIKNAANKFLRDIIVASYSSVPYNQSMIYILTSGSMQNYSNSMQNAKADFENLNKDFVVWLHLKNDSDSIRMLMNVKVNISKTEAESIINLEYSQTMSFYNESISWYEDEFQIEDEEYDDIEAIEFDEGEIEEEDTIVTLVKNDDNGKSKENDSKFSDRLNNLIDRSINHPYDCSTLQCFSLKWRAYCCLLSDNDRNNVATDYVALYQKAIVSGIVDGLVETGDFVYTLLDMQREFNPYVAVIDLNILAIRYGASKALDIKKERYLDLWENTITLTQSIMNPQTWNLMVDMIKQGLDELVFKEGITIQGYRVGNVIFAILLDFATSGGAEVKTIAQITKKGAQEILKISKNPQVFASAIKSATTKYVNNSKKNLKKLKFATAGRLNTQRTIRNKFLNGKIDLGAFGSYTYKKRTGNIGEICVDVDLQEKGYQIFTRPVLHIDDNVHKGLDHVATKNGQYYVIESKYNTAKQKVFGGNLQGSYDYAVAESRLLKACGQEVYNDIREKGFILLLAKINPNGNITYHILDEFGRKTGTYWTP
jgi:hypothetical protein